MVGDSRRADFSMNVEITAHDLFGLRDLLKDSEAPGVAQRSLYRSKLFVAQRCLWLLHALYLGFWFPSQLGHVPESANSGTPSA